MDIARFRELAREGYNRIPLAREILADFDTPLSTYLKLADGPHSYLFESVQGGEKWGRYSIIGLPCSRVIRIHGHEITSWQDGEAVATETVADPLAWIADYQQQFRVLHQQHADLQPLLLAMREVAGQAPSVVGQRDPFQHRLADRIGMRGARAAFAQRHLRQHQAAQCEKGPPTIGPEKGQHTAQVIQVATVAVGNARNAGRSSRSAGRGTSRTPATPGSTWTAGPA